jgi:hypothetical protein
MSQLAATFMPAQDSGEAAIMAVIALAVVTVLAGLISTVPADIAAATIDVPSLALTLI